MQWERYRDIIWYRAYAELKAEAQLNYMGYVWWLLEPLLNTVDVKAGWMVTESRNLDWTGVLNVIERQVYTPSKTLPAASEQAADSRRPLSSDGRTDVETTVTLRSPLGEQRWKQRR